VEEPHFTGGPGTGKSRAARTYHELGLLTYGHLLEIAAADLTGITPRETGTLIGKAIKPTGDLLMITDAHTWHVLPDPGQHVLRCLYQKLTAARPVLLKAVCAPHYATLDLIFGHVVNARLAAEADIRSKGGNA
jgi:hypothetical protein